MSFDELQHRISSIAAAVARLAHEWPASYAAFDVLAVAGQDTRGLPLRNRRALLEELADGWSAPLNLSPATRDAGEAAEWLETMTACRSRGPGHEGRRPAVSGGQRQWVKVKHRDTLDVVCAAVIGDLQRPEALVVGLPVDGELQIVGRSTPLRAASSRALGRLLQPSAGPHPWPAQVKPGALDRFNSGVRDVIDLTLVEPIVVEISADVAMGLGRRGRHSPLAVWLDVEGSAPASHSPPVSS